MAIIHWSASLSTGVETIDEQHRRLLEYLNRVHEIMVENRDEEELQEVFEGLMEYTAIHFRHEEELFDRYRYPFATGHRREHDRLRERLASEITEYREKRRDLMYLLAFLVDWLMDHIQGTDKAFGDYLAVRRVPGF